MHDERKQHWERIYHDKSPLEVSWYQTAPSLSLELIRVSGCDPASPLIDVGGGASTLVDHLLDAGFSAVSVLDISSRALAHARQRLGERAGQVQWIASDITGFEPTGTYALWHDRAVFHFLTEAEDRLRYRQVLRRALAKGGQVIMGTFAPGGPEVCSGLPIVQYDGARLQAELGARFRLLETRSELHRTPAGTDQPFNFFRLVQSA